MSTRATSTLSPTAPAQQAVEPCQKYRVVLDELIDMGMDIARQVHAEATAEHATLVTPAQTELEAAPRPDLTIKFDRIARTVRRTVALARRLDEPVAEAGDEQRRVAARRRILRVVEDVIQREARGPEREKLEAELLERMDAPELDDEIDLRPTADIIADIVRDLELDRIPGGHPWKRRTPEDVAVLATRAASPKPFVMQPEEERIFRLLTTP
jgi:hypothetical protein